MSAVRHADTGPAKPSPVPGRAVDRDDPRAPRWVRWFATGVIAFATGALAPFVGGGADGDVGVIVAIWGLLYLVAGALLLDGTLRRRMRVPVPVALVAFVLLAIASIGWSVAPVVTGRRAVGLLGTVVVGLLLAQRMRPVELLDAVRDAVVLVALASLLLFVIGDPRAIDPVHDSLQGVVATKNTLGRVLGLGILAVALSAFLDRARVRRGVISAVPMVAALVLTDSVGGLLVAGLAVTLITGAAIWTTRAGKLLLGGSAALAIGVTTLALPATTPEDVADLLGRDLTVTGRTEIWSMSLDAAEDRPALGHGYGAFWHEDGAEASARIAARLYWPVPNAHNGLLDVVLELGVVGGVLAIAVALTLLGRGVADARAGRRDAAALRLAVALLLVVSNAAESSFLQENQFLTLVVIAALAATEPGPRLAPRRPSAPAPARRVPAVRP